MSMTSYMFLALVCLAGLVTGQSYDPNSTYYTNDVIGYIGSGLLTVIGVSDTSMALYPFGVLALLITGGVLLYFGATLPILLLFGILMSSLLYYAGALPLWVPGIIVIIGSISIINAWNKSSYG